MKCKHTTCMLVEDEALAIEMMRDYINRRDELVLIGIASQMSEIQDILDQFTPSIIFLDFTVPPGESDGFHFGMLPPDANIIVVSAIPLAHFKGNLPKGDIHELPKPISFDSFNRCVNQVLDKLSGR